MTSWTLMTHMKRPMLVVKTTSNINVNHIVEQPHSLSRLETFRKICFNHINYIKCIEFPSITTGSIYEAVLIEYRILPHMEFLIRNTIIKLGEKWSHTVICGNLNYDFIVNMCSSISDQIKVIRTDYDNLFPSDYSKFLTSLDFWNLLTGDKILIYQEDSIIFKSNINDFLEWDYIGAPWPKHQNDTKSGVGNGGLSLRTKKVMIDVINTLPVSRTIFNPSTHAYIKSSKSTHPPEDVYFSKNIEDFWLGRIADRKTASLFSTESIVNKDSFGGHQFWLLDDTWVDRMYQNNIIVCKPRYDISHLEHRGGWKSIISELIDTSFYHDTSHFEFFDIVENYFLWNVDHECKNNWAGIIHCTPNVPEYLNIVDVSKLFKNKNFIKSMNKCKYIITLSNYMTNYLSQIFTQFRFYVPIYTLKHPVDSNNIIMFDYENYLQNTDKKLIQIGIQLRKVSSIYQLAVPQYGKLWLTGTTNYAKCRFYLKKEIEYFKLDEEKLDKNVKMYYTSSYKEYDEFLSNNIVFIDLFNASANNAIVECIARNTPIIINKIDAVVEYLGKDYPLYFTNLTDVPLLLTNEKIKEAHDYLSRMNKDEFSIPYFITRMINIHSTVLRS